ncbi:MAG: cytochrome P460 family protein [Pirellulales bacterium]|nr:cytochrome P460 family protein [Pirellulales bacterium]
MNRKPGFHFAAFAAIACSLAAVVHSVADETPGPATEPKSTMTLPEYNAEGSLLRPEGYERWTLVGTSLGLDYSPGQKPDPSKPGLFHNVYMQPEAFDHYVATGEFLEQTIFVVTNNPAAKLKGDDEINRNGHYAAPSMGLEVSVRDTERFEDDWGFFMYYSTTGKRTTSKPFKREACYDCHAQHGEDNAVFTQFYSVLKTARARKLAETAK